MTRALAAHGDWINTLLAEPTLFTVIDTYPIELLFSIREGRSKQQIGKKRRDKGRWSIGVKLCWLLNKYGQVVGWDWNTMNVHDQQFSQLLKLSKTRVSFLQTMVSVVLRAYRIISISALKGLGMSAGFLKLLYQW